METHICENCGKEHNGSYGSGRFCSKHCRMAYIGRKSIESKKKNGTFISGFAIAKKGKHKRASYGTWKCSLCQEIFETRAKLEEHRRKIHNITKETKQPWNKGKTKETDERLKKAGEIYHQKFLLGEIDYIKPKHSKEVREKLSEIRSKQLENSNAGFSDVKWYKVNNIDGQEYTVRGTWELNVANILNELKIRWVRNKIIHYENDIRRTYNPDFYLPESDKYIEVKGYYSDKDKLKMKLVLEQHPDIKIYFLNAPNYKEFLSEKKLLDKYLFSV